MKAVFLFLILANGLLYLWQSYFVSPDEIAPRPLRVSVPELVLLEEEDITAQPLEVTVQSVTTQAEELVIEGAQTDTAFINSAEAFASIKYSCYTVGPFINDDELEMVLGLFATRKLDYEQRTLTESELFGYNVLIPSFATREEASAMVDVLVKKGISDYYIMTEPEYKHAISLGLFREHRFAIQHLNLLQKKGVKAEMLTRYFDRNRHWLDYIDADDAIDVIEVSRLSPESDVQRLARSCS